MLAVKAADITLHTQFSHCLRYHFGGERSWFELAVITPVSCGLNLRSHSELYFLGGRLNTLIGFIATSLKSFFSSKIVC